MIGIKQLRKLKSNNFNNFKIIFERLVFHSLSNTNFTTQILTGCFYRFEYCRIYEVCCEQLT